MFISVFSNNKHNHEESLFIIIYMTKINLSQVWQVMIYIKDFCILPETLNLIVKCIS